MSQRVPKCYTDATTVVRSTTAADIPMLEDYEVAELTWENGQPGLHGLGPPRVPVLSKYSTGGAGGTLESIVDQATRLPVQVHPKPNKPNKPKPTTDDELVSAVPWTFHHHRSMDALVPCSNLDQEPTPTRVGSCSSGHPLAPPGGKRARVAPPPAPEWSVSGSQQRLTIDTYGFTSTSLDDNSNKTNTIDDHDSVCHSRQKQRDQEEEEEDDDDQKKGGEKSSVSTKRSRAAAIHNQSERKRRDKINQRMKTLQKMVPNSSKTDKASMLDEVIEYLKQLQAQVSMMSRMNIPSMMLPMAAMQQQQQQQLHHQLSLMSNPMAAGLGLGMGIPGLGLHANMIPNPFVSQTSWDASSSSSNDCTSRFHQSPLMPTDPMAAFLACSSQPTTMEAYSRMAAIYQQMQQQLPPPPHPHPPSSNPK